jgi:hypothetical protein
MNPNYVPDPHQPVGYAVGNPYDAASAPPPAPATYEHAAGHAVPPPAPLTRLPSVQNDGNLREYLQRNSWPPSMQDYFITSLERIPVRFFICDDSGSMGISDGERVVTYGTQKK